MARMFLHDQADPKLARPEVQIWLLRQGLGTRGQATLTLDKDHMSTVDLLP